MGNKKVLLTSSDNYSQEEITSQLGVVDSQIVVGANIFRDVFAGFRDLFGGETKGYKKDLDKMKNAAFSSIKEQTRERGGNAVISLRIDLDEVSGGGKSMFMLNVYGSAVQLKDSVFNSAENANVVDEISLEDLEFYQRRNDLKNKLNEVESISDEVNLDKISEYNLWTKNVSLKTLSAFDSPSESLVQNLSEIPTPYIEEFLLDHIENLDLRYWSRIIEDLENRNWFNYQLIKELLNNDNHVSRFRAVNLCLIRKDFYKSGEADNLKELGNFLITDLSTLIEKKEVDKMIGTKEVYKCPYCLRETKVNTNCECGRNKYGLKPYSRTPEIIGENLMSLAKALESAFTDRN